MTEKLFDIDSYIKEFTCKVISLYTKDDKLYIETDRTAFFPEGGGQTSDIGKLGCANVENVQNIDGKIYHFVENSEENVKFFTIGKEIKGEICWKKRFSDMQQHSGEHIFSGIVHSLFGYDNVGFHLGSETVTLDFNGVLTKEDMCKVELLVNKAVWANSEVKVFFPSDEELALIDYRSKKEIDGQVRLVEFPGVDICACCAPHVKNTGEIGIIQVVSFEKYKGGTRVSILCGERALADIRHKLDENHSVSVLMSAKEKETAQAVERIKKEKESLDYEIVGLKKEILSLKLASIKADKRIIIFDSSLEGKMLQDYALSLMERAEEFVCCFCGEKGQYRYCMVSDKLDPLPYAKALNEAFTGKGGGRNGIVQGTVSGEEDEIREFLTSPSV
ncbi:MAG: alanyl-tRNA editing protein [Clostridia bacterium]|nr:alanyl-tRNA editing protein [Clostridia bacterium]